VGGALRSLYNNLLPIAKCAGEKILSSPEGGHALKSIRNSAIDAGLNIVLDKVSGRNSGKSIKKNLTQAKNEIAEAVTTNARRAVKRTVNNVLRERKIRKTEKDIFDEDSLDDEV
jgi:predicted regulator of amino acid metabolism with ACT domain